MHNKKYKIKPCPFCGSDAEVQYGYFDYNVYQVVCNGCQATAGYEAEEAKKAIKAWNRRSCSNTSLSKILGDRHNLNLDAVSNINMSGDKIQLGKASTTICDKSTDLQHNN